MPLPPIYKGVQCFAEPIKGGLSDSMKRAAVQWGIGRVLYNMEPVLVSSFTSVRITSTASSGCSPRTKASSLSPWEDSSLSWVLVELIPLLMRAQNAG
mgnify:CR=1 FL=1